MRLAWVVVVMGCSKSGSGGECKTAAHELGTFLTTMDHDTSAFEDLPDVELARRDVPSPRLYEAAVVYVKPNAYVLGGDVVDAKSLGSKLTEMHAQLLEDIAAHKVPRNWPEEASHRLHLMIDGRTPWSRVVEVAGLAFASGYDQPALVFSRPPKAPPPPATASSREIDVLLAHSDEKASVLADYTKPIVARCPSLIEAFGNMANGNDPTATLLASIEPALVACDCAVDLEKLRAALWAVAGNPSPKGALHIVLDRDAPPITMAPTTAWSEANAKLAPGAHVWLK